MTGVVSLEQAKRDAKKKPRRTGGAPPNDGSSNGEPNAWRPPCPIEALGHREGKFVFFDRAGQLRIMAANSLSNASEIMALFGPGIDWCAEHFPQLDRDGNQVPGVFSNRAVAKYLIQACYAAGLFRLDEPRRGHGVWRAGDEILVHCGDVVIEARRGIEAEAGFRRAGALWPALPPIPRPAIEVASAAECRFVAKQFARWNWEQPGAPQIMLGLWAAGLLGAAITWRPHALIVGPQGSGKSTLMGYYCALSPVAAIWNDYTEAGLRQALSGRAGPCILDEAEGDESGVAKLQRVIELLRRTSGGTGAQVVRGSAGGAAQSFEVVCSALLGGILPPTLQPQDASRITRLDLWPRQDNGPGLPDDAALAAAREAAPRLWARALAGLPRFRDNLALLRADMLDRGCAPRLCDQVGTILAAFAMMTEDQALDAIGAADLVDRFNWLAVSEAEAAPESGAAQCLAHLLQSPAELQRHGERPPMARLVAEAQQSDGGHEARRVLGDHGLQVAPYPPGAADGPLCLYVANRHPRLARIFEGTQWAGGRWREDLRRLPLASALASPIRIGGVPTRCTAIPADLLPAPTAPPPDPSPG